MSPSSRSRQHVAVTTSIAAGLTAAVISIGACGGRVDGSSSSTSTSPAPTGTERPPSTTPGRRPPTDALTTAAVASQIAASYCKTFSSCCVASGQPPVDVSRCRVLTSAAVQQQLDGAGAGDYSLDSVDTCVQAIHTRIAACGTVDAKWWEQDPVGLFGPGSVQKACASVLGATSATSGELCAKTLPCSGAQTCAIDECVDEQRLGASCAAKSPCVDGAVCTGAVCAPEPDGALGAACTASEDCRLGLVCAKSACAPAREHPELYMQRYSPYRIGLDTCRALTYL